MNSPETFQPSSNNHRLLKAGVGIGLAAAAVVAQAERADAWVADADAVCAEMLTSDQVAAGQTPEALVTSINLEKRTEGMNLGMNFEFIDKATGKTVAVSSNVGESSTKSVRVPLTKSAVVTNAKLTWVDPTTGDKLYSIDDVVRDEKTKEPKDIVLPPAETCIVEVPATTTTTVEQPVPTTTTPATNVEVPVERIAFTGSETTRNTKVGGALIAVGGLLLAIGQRRKRNIAA